MFRPLAVALLLVPLLAACTGTRVHPAPPVDKSAIAQVPGFEGVRAWGDELPDDTVRRARKLSDAMSSRMRQGEDLPNGGVVDVLVLSGGGSDGAYGAGLLSGWTARGGRPEFWVVTGISTGALIAPFAFAGPEFDPELERFYTNTRTEDLITIRLLDALMGKLLGVADPTSMAQVVEAALTPKLIERIAAEHRRGRRLLIGTTNLDAQRPVVWDIGRIANSSHPGARRLIRDILLASAAIPGAFPPVQIVVEADGERFTEMHVDGGVTRQLFFLPPGLKLDRLAAITDGALKMGTIYLLRNTKLDPTYAQTEAGVVPIAQRSISTLIKFAGVADVSVVESQARENGFMLKVTAVPESFSHEEAELFDPGYMRALYEIGYGLAVEGNPWRVIFTPDGKSSGPLP